MSQRTVEIWVGFFMLLGIGAILMLALQVSGLTSAVTQGGYVVTAKFENIGGLKPRAPVSMAGVKIGQVEHIELDPASFKAIVTLRILANQNMIPSDSAARIMTEGLLGSNYISLIPGFEETFLKNGSMIQETRSAMLLENLIGQLMFKLGDGGKKHGSKSEE